MTDRLAFVIAEELRMAGPELIGKLIPPHIELNGRDAPTAEFLEKHGCGAVAHSRST